MYLKSKLAELNRLAGMWKVLLYVLVTLIDKSPCCYNKHAKVHQYDAMMNFYSERVGMMQWDDKVNETTFWLSVRFTLTT